MKNSAGSRSSFPPRVLWPDPCERTRQRYDKLIISKSIKPRQRVGHAFQDLAVLLSMPFGADKLPLSLSYRIAYQVASQLQSEITRSVNLSCSWAAARDGFPSEDHSPGQTAVRTSESFVPQVKVLGHEDFASITNRAPQTLGQSKGYTCHDLAYRLAPSRSACWLLY